MKKILLSLLCFICIGICANAANEAIFGWGSSGNTSYSTRTNSDGWTATNAALVNVDNTICPTLNGKTSAKGVLTSPDLSGGISSLTLKAINTYKDTKGISLKAEIKQNGAVVASHDFTDAAIEQNSIFSQTWDGFNINGEFVIVITNNCPSNKNSNADRVSIASLTWEEGVAVNPNAPESVEISSVIEGSSAQITLSCPTEGVEIFYGFSEDSMENEYTSPFTVTENCTIYAYAVKGEEKSSVSNYYVDLPYTSFKKVVCNSMLTDAVSIIGDFQVIYQNKDKGRLILTDGESNILIYRNSTDYSIDYPVGTKISKIEGTVAVYNSCFRLIDAVLTEGGDGADYAPIELLSFNGLNYEDNLFDEILIKNCDISGKDLGSPVITLGDETAVLYDLFAIGYENVSGCDITGFVWRVKDILEIVPISIEGGMVASTVDTPVISPNQRELKPEDQVTITCETQNVNIYYTLDGSDPTDESTLYDGPFAFKGDEVIVKARAYYCGNDENINMFPSAIASHTYHVWDPYCNIITEGNHDADDKNSLNTYKKHSCIVDGVEYHMNAAHLGEGGNGNDGSKNSLMLNNSTTKNKERLCYVLQASENEGLFVDKIELAYNNNAKTVFAVRGANTPFDDSADDYEDYKAAIENHGDLIGNISKDNQSIEFENDYKYFAFYPTNTGAVYLDNITIRYRDPLPLAAPDILGLEDIDEDEIVFDEDEEIYLVAADHALNIDFDVDSESNIKVMYILVPENSEFDEVPAPVVYDGTSIVIDQDASFVYWAFDIETEETTEPIKYFFMISLPEAPAAPVLKVNGVVFEEETINGTDTVKVNFEAPEGIDIYYNLVAGETEAPKKAHGEADHTGYTLHNGEEVELNNTHLSLSFYACDPATGLHSDTTTYTVGIATGVNEIEEVDADAIYFNLQGVQISKPENGLYIRVKKGNAAKIVK